MCTLISISGSGCAGCVSLHNEVKQIAIDFPQLQIEYRSIDDQNEDVMKLVKKYHIEKIPTLVLLKDDVEIGKVSGYQPAEILSYWLEDKLDN